MKLILCYISFILAVFLLVQCEKEEPQVIFKDNNFLNALIELGVDKDANGIISPEEAEAIDLLNLSESEISDLTGIEFFINLNLLDCYGNHLPTLDISSNKDFLMLPPCEYNNRGIHIITNIIINSFFIEVELRC